MLGYGRRLAALEKKLEELEKKLEELEDAYDRVTALEADWQDWLHKIRNVLARLNQRARDQEELETNPHTPLARRSINPAAARLLGIKEG